MSPLSRALFLVALAAAGAEPVTPQSVRARLASVRMVHSADGLTTVSVPSAISGADALALCHFAGDVRSKLGTLLDASLDDERYATDLLVREDADGGSPYVACSVAGSGQGRIRLEIGGLETVRPESATIALCGGLLRANALASGWRDPVDVPVDIGAAPYPPWIRLGAARLLDASVRQDDAERAIGRLERGELPPLAELFAPEGSPAGADPALAAQLVAWLLDDIPRQARFRALRDAIVASGAWDVEAAFRLASGTEDAAGADAAWRAWLARRKWSILTPGLSHPAFVRRLRGLLELRPPSAGRGASAERSPPNTDPAAFPGDSSVAAQPEILASIPPAAYEACGGVITPSAVFLHAGEEWAPHAAMALSGRILRAAAGHGDDVLAVARAYGAFFDAVRSRAPRAELARRLALADDLLRVVEGE